MLFDQDACPGTSVPIVGEVVGGPWMPTGYLCRRLRSFFGEIGNVGNRERFEVVLPGRYTHRRIVPDVASVTGVTNLVEAATTPLEGT